MKQRNKKIAERRKRRILSGIIAVVLVAAMGLGMFLNFETKVQAAPNTVVDPDTTNNWSSIAASSNSTENIGRIWTDKSVFNKDYEFSGALNGQSVVKGDADFLVSLSAMSSTSNLRSTTTTTRPLDIVLVLDRSGSMDENIYSYTYSEVYSDNVSENGWTQYFAQTDDGAYVQIERKTSWGWFDHWELDGVKVEPKTSAGDNEQNHIQFYTRRSSSMSKMQALKNAAKEFIEMTAEQPNAEQHRIGIVSFSGSSNDQNDDERHANLTYLAGQNVNSLTRTIDNIRSDNGTYPTSALEDAQYMLQNSGRDSQKVVIFFTDGMPGAGSSFNGNVANASISVAHDMKTDDVLVYSIGVLTGADPSADVSNVSDRSNDSSKVNAYLHAISSNYPDATGYISNRMGNRAPDSDYYFAASDAEELSDVFEKISSSMPTDDPSGSPIEEVTSGGGAENTPGYLTFTDTLGNYMELVGVGEENDTVYLAFANGIYRGKSTDGGHTWTFSGVVEGGVNSAYPDDVDLSTAITMTVEKSANSLETGDTVTVKIPASLIPLRNYDVDTTAGTMTVSDDTYPVRLFYGVSLKAEAKEALNNPTSNDYATIVASQKSEKGDSIDFYSNSYLKDADEGSTEATFTPNVNNRFYYYPVDTQLFINESCTEPATQNNVGQYSTLYYKDSYWQLTDDSSDGNTAQEVPITGSITRGSGEWNLKYTNGNVYIAEHTPRSDRPASLVVAKGTDGNVTETASNVLTPMWEGTDVSQHLGNNGKLSFDMPGSLEIKKTVDWGNASDSTKQNPDKNKFTFEITANVPADEGDAAEPLNGTYNYYVGDSEDAAGQVAFTDGKAKLTIEGGTTVRIDGMPAGAAFTVAEKGVGQNGWTVTDGTTQQGASNDNKTDGVVTGTIESGSQVSLTFDNTYKAADVDLSTKTTLSVKKTLEGRGWRDSDKFTFKIDGLGNTAGDGIATPEPAETTVTIDDQTEYYTKAFGDITFTAPGEYRYSITEDNDTDPINGIDYSAAIYRVVVTVTDDGNGKLVVSKVELQQTQNDAGTMGADAQPIPVEGSTATFTNTYDVNAATTNIDGTKVYNDTTGGNVIDYGKFTFQIEALGGYETEGGSSPNYTVEAGDVPMPAGVAEGTTTKQVTNTGYGFKFGTISYDGNDAGKTFEYKVTEIAGNEQGMTYAGTEHIVKVKVEEVTTGEGTPQEETHLVATPDMTPQQVSFTNTYDPTDARLTGDSAIHGTKTFTGRDMEDDEKFYFQLTQTSGPVVNAETGEQDMILDQPKIVEITKDEMQNGSADFDFGDMAFSRTGEYKFTVNEVAPDGQSGYIETSNGSGMTYDTNICTVTVKVTDNKQGALDAGVTYSNDVNTTVTDKAQFNNTYKASMNYGAEGKGGIVVTKQLTNRPMDAKEFAFSIMGVANDSGKTTAEDANKKLTEEDKSFNNTASAADQIITMAKLQNVSFDQTDAGKTYSYIVDETTEDDAKTLPGVNCDQTQYRVDIQVVDNGDGTMHTLTTVTKIKNAAGEDMTETVINAVNSDAQGYAAPSFGFVNEYNPNPATVGEDADDKIEVTKKVTGADSATDYTFTLTAQETEDGHISNISGLNDSHQLTVTTDDTIKAGESQTKTFGNLTFTEPGTYTFTVQENQPDADEGWTFDDGNSDGTTDTHTVKVQVTDRNDDNEYDGNLYIANVIGSPVEINNSYKAGPVIVGGDGADQQITVQKSVTGADSTADFQFKIEPVDPDDDKWNNVERIDKGSDEMTVSITDGVTQAQSKTANFAGIQFNATGEYQFKITEVGAAEFNQGDNRNGWTYDEHEAIVTVKVTDDNFDGKLDATVSYENGAQAAEFTNKYEAGSATLKGEEIFKGTKTIEGRNGIKDETFGFTLKQGNVSGGGSWDAVTFQPKDGEDKPFDTADATATMAKGKNSADFSFDGIFTFSKAGTYTFNVTETSHNGEALPTDGTNGMTYDRHTGTITVTVTDDGKGNLNAIATPGTIGDGDAENDMTFENAYQATPGRWGFADSELLGGHKYINDTTGNTYTLEADQYSFTMRAQAAGNPMPDGWDGTTVDDQGRGMMTVTNGTGNTTDINIYDFGWIEFTHDDMANATEVDGQPGVYTKTFQYNIFETGTMPAGISRDNTAYTVTFTVTEDHNTGKIKVATPTATKIVEGSGGAGDPADVTKLDFTNTYNPTSIEGHQNFFKTLTGRNWQKGDTFTFNVSMTATEADGSEWPDGAPLPSVKASDGYDFSEVKTNDEGNGLDYTVTINPTSQTDNTYRFDTGTITYEREGIYTWTVSEQQSTVNHVTSDSTVYTVKVTVTDNNGVLDRKVELTDGNYGQHEGDQTLDFTNVYKPNEVSTDDKDGIGNIQVTKEVKGNATSAEFNFKLTLESGNVTNILTDKDDPQSTFPVDGITKATSGDFADGDTKAVDFGSLTFTAAGDYTFKVVETDTAPANWTYANGDANAKTITIHVTDPDNGGQLVASYDTDEANNPTFTNSYKADGSLDGDAEGAKNLVVTKTIDGRKFQKDDTFTFQLTADKNNPAGATLPENAEGITIAYADGDDTASKTVAFGDITFTLPGTYTFYVSEQTPADKDKLGGMTYSDEQYTVTVEVTDAQDGNGKLDTAITTIVNKAGTEVEALAFTNTYKAGGTTDLPATGEGSIQLKKVLTGKEWNGDEFTFKLEAVSNTAGVDPASQPMPETSEKTINEKTDTNEDGNDYADFTFGPITYDQAGTYVYKVTETAGSNGGITYDSHAATVIVTVADNLHGGFTATASVENGVFTNNYKSELDFAAAGGLEIVKNFENADMREFSFTVTPKDRASAEKLGIDIAGKTFTTKPGATIGDDNASHAKIMVIDAGTEAKFTQGDADDTYTYTVQETKETDGSVDYDSTVYTVTITTADDGQGGIKVTTMVTDGAGYNESYVYDNDDATNDPTAIVPFTNTYKATGELGGNGNVSIKATKTLTNRPMTDGEFTFNVTNTADATNAVVATGTNAADGTINFSAISYSIDQMLKDVDNGLATPSVVDGKNTFTYQYTVAEDHASFDKGVTAIADSFGITVTVTDNGDGTLGIAVAYPDGSDGLTFRNAYGEGDQGKATLNIAGEKKLDVQSGNNAPDITGKYTFTLTGEDGAPMPAQTTATNDAAGNVNFGDITYTMENVFGDTGVQAAAPTDETAANADTGEAAVDGEASGESGAAANAADVDIQSAQRTKTFTYTVTESGTVEGVDNDAQTSKTFTVMITDNGKGTISAVSDPAQGAKFSFTNTYSVDPTDSSLTGDGNLTITKKLTGRDLAEGEFKVVMTDKDGAEAASGTNDVQGNIGLSVITFTQPGDYTYDLYEVAGDKGGVTYDSTRYIATAHVEDKGNGTLEVTWSVTDVEGNPIDGTEITFNNTYKAEATSVSLGTGKLIEGRDLEAGEFSFLLSDKDGNEISTAKNEKNGAVTFDTITYDKAGTYEYNISEVLPKDDDSKTDGIQKDNVTYDESVYQVTVEVTDDNAGHLSASVTYKDSDGAPLFVNKYTKPADNTPAGDDGNGGGTILGVKTGDVAEILPLLIVMAAAIVVIIAMSVILIRRRRR